MHTTLRTPEKRPRIICSAELSPRMVKIRTEKEAPIQPEKRDSQIPSPTEPCISTLMTLMSKPSIVTGRTTHVQTLKLTSMTNRGVPTELWKFLKAGQIVSKSMLFRHTETAIPRNDVFDMQNKRGSCHEKLFSTLYSLARTNSTKHTALKMQCHQVPYMAPNRRFSDRQKCCCLPPTNMDPDDLQQRWE